MDVVRALLEREKKGKGNRRGSNNREERENCVRKRGDKRKKKKPNKKTLRLKRPKVALAGRGDRGTGCLLHVGMGLLCEAV